MHRFVISVMCAAALGLAGCMLGGSENVAQGVSHAGLDEPAGAAQDTRQANGLDIPLDLPELSDFTTEGKPTKTIETPWGPREVYDATKDPEIVKVFNQIYNTPNSGLPISAKYEEGSALHLAYKILEQASYQQRQSYEALYCKLLVDANCYVWWQKKPCLTEDGEFTYENCKHELIASGSGAPAGCTISEKTVFTNWWHPIGPNFFADGWDVFVYESREVPSREEQFENYFAIECKKYEEMP